MEGRKIVSNHEKSVIIIIESREWKEWKEQIKKSKYSSFIFKIFSPEEKRGLIKRNLYKIEDFKQIKFKISSEKNGGYIFDKDVAEKLISCCNGERPEEIEIYDEWKWDNLGKNAGKYFVRVELTKIYNIFNH